MATRSAALLAQRDIAVAGDDGDVVCLSRSREDGVTLAQTAKVVGSHAKTWSKWMRRADVEDGEKPANARAGPGENRELKKQIRRLGQENDLLRRAADYVSSANRPGKGATCS